MKTAKWWASLALLLATAIPAPAALFLAVQADKQQVQSRYMALDNEHIHLLSARAQLSSRERITKIAGTRLQLFEPAENQVQRM